MLYKHLEIASKMLFFASFLIIFTPKSCNKAELLNELENLKPWINEKCELYHWVDVLNICDSVLERACQKENESISWVLACDLPENKNVSTTFKL